MNTKQELLQNPLVKEIAMQFASEQPNLYMDGAWAAFVKSNEPVREWEILKVKLDKIYTKYEEGGHFYFQTERIERDSPNVEKYIYSVRRNSDMVVFTVGDTINYGKIKSFELGKSMIIVDAENGFCYDLMEIKPERKPLFTTTDLKPIYEGDRYRVLFDDGSSYSEVATKKTANIQYKTFSNKDAENEYITLNKPCLSVSDVLSFTFSESVHVKRLQEQLLELAKAKQNNS